MNNSGEQFISHWEYGTPAPAPNSLPVLNHSELLVEHEDTKIHKCDIYTSLTPATLPPRGALVSTTMSAVTMVPLRRTHITTEGDAGTISLQPGVYKFTVTGKRFGNLAFTVSLATVLQTPQIELRKYSVRSEDFDFCCVSQLTTATTIAVRTQKPSEVSTALGTVITLIIERI